MSRNLTKESVGKRPADDGEGNCSQKLVKVEKEGLRVEKERLAIEKQRLRNKVLKLTHKHCSLRNSDISYI